MDSRRSVRPASSMSHTMEALPLPILLENKISSQSEEIKRLARDNHILASSHLKLMQDVAASQGEAEKLREHIRNIQVEGDLEIHILLDKYAKMEADIRAGDTIRKELQEAHKEAQSLVIAKVELTAKIDQATKELENARADAKKIPGKLAELDNLRQEHQRLRKAFEYEKGLNTEKVEQMENLEKHLIGIAGEIERLHARVQDAEQRASGPVPCSSTHLNANYLYPPLVQENSGHADSSAGPHFFHATAGPPTEGVNPSGGGGNGLVIVSQPMNGSFVTAAPVASYPATDRTNNVSLAGV